jgi:hypothetical protein
MYVAYMDNPEKLCGVYRISYEVRKIQRRDLCVNPFPSTADAAMP